MNIKKIVGIGIVLSSVCLAHGAAIQFDFGRTTTPVYNGNNAPAALSGTQTNWNGVGGSDVTSGLLYADGTAATGVSLNAGGGPDGDGGTINWANNLGSYSATPSASAPDIYQTDLMGDWNFYKNGNVGVQITGLTAGDYAVYAIVREHNALDRSYDVGIGLNGSLLGDLAYQDSIAADVVVDGTAAWTAGINYVMTTVTVGSTADAITVITDDQVNVYSNITGIQIVAVPEPATLGLIVAFGGGLLFIRRNFKI